VKNCFICSYTQNKIKNDQGIIKDKILLILKIDQQ